jgi:flagella basal body P-ring formation protein FlgA
MIMLPFLLAVNSVPAVCRAIDTETVVAHDVAAVIPAFAQLPGDFLLGYVNASGTPRIFRGSDLERIAKNRGVDLHGLPDVCLARRTFLPQPGQLREAMLAELKIPAAKIEIVSSSQHLAPTGELVFPRAGLQLPAVPSSDAIWHGYVLYGDNLKFPVWARARITASMTRVVAVTDLAVGKLIQANQIRLESCEDSPLDELTARNLDEVIGYMPKSPLKAATPIRKSQIERPADIKQGDVIRVDVFEGGAHLMLEARAETTGSKGSKIMVKNDSSGKSFQALVTGKDQAMVGGPVQ